MQKSSLYTLLILVSWIPLSVRSQVSDTSRCYGLSELRKIALALTKGQHCDSLLSICDSVTSNQATIIRLKNRQISNLQSESALKDIIISGKEREKQAIQLDLDKTTRRLVWTKVGWLSTFLVLTAGMTYFAFHRS